MKNGDGGGRAGREPAAVAAVEGDRRALAGQRGGDGEADPGGGTGDEGAADADAARATSYPSAVRNEDNVRPENRSASTTSSRTRPGAALTDDRLRTWNRTTVPRSPRRPARTVTSSASTSTSFRPHPRSLVPPATAPLARETGGSLRTSPPKRASETSPARQCAPAVSSPSAPPAPDTRLSQVASKSGAAPTPGVRCAPSVRGGERCRRRGGLGRRGRRG